MRKHMEGNINFISLDKRLLLEKLKIRLHSEIHPLRFLKQIQMVPAHQVNLVFVTILCDFEYE